MSVRFIYVGYVCTGSLLLSCTPLYECITWTLGCIQFLVILGKAAMIILTSLWGGEIYIYLFLLGKYLEVELLCYRTCLIL